MAIDKYNKIWKEIFILSENPPFLEISHLSIPFSALKDSKNPQDIYVGNEKISFKERRKDYKKIFLQEFLP